MGRAIYATTWVLGVGVVVLLAAGCLAVGLTARAAGL